MASKKPGFMQKSDKSAPASGKDFIAQKIAERKQKAADAKQPGSAPGQKPGMKKEPPMGAKKPMERKPKEQTPAKKEEAKVFLKGKADKVAKKDQQKQPERKGAVAEQVIRSKAPVKEKKEAVLANARKKMGVNEEKRADFQQRSKQSQAKRVATREKKEGMNKGRGPA